VLKTTHKTHTKIVKNNDTFPLGHQRNRHIKGKDEPG